MMIFIPNFLKEHIHNQSVNKIITGISIGLFESSIITPFERLKTLRMTSMSTGFGYMKYITFESIYVGFRI
jgi:solute carrier family 25 citrate transporter 1